MSLLCTREGFRQQVAHLPHWNMMMGPKTKIDYAGETQQQFTRLDWKSVSEPLGGSQSRLTVKYGLSPVGLRNKYYCWWWSAVYIRMQKGRIPGIQFI
jgi:hypothetical protein